MTISAEQSLSYVVETEEKTKMHVSIMQAFAEMPILSDASLLMVSLGRIIWSAAFDIRPRRYWRLTSISSPNPV